MNSSLCPPLKNPGPAYVECRVIWFNAGGCLRCTCSYMVAAYELISSRLIGGSDQFVCQLVFQQLDTLRNVFDPLSLSHVQNWPSENCEKQCHRLGEEFHRFSTEYLSDLSTQLTQARSQVRTSEILATLQEQRILYIRQQVKDLERSISTCLLHVGLLFVLVSLDVVFQLIKAELKQWLIGQCLL